MTRLHVGVVMLLGVALPSTVYAANASFSFELPNEDVGPKVVVTEFLDPDETGLGKVLSYLVWHELLTAIGRTPTDVIFVPAAAMEGGLDQLKATRHRAALEVAQRYHASLALWGEVNMRGQGPQARLLVQTFATLNPDVRDGNLALGLAVSHAGGTGRFQAALPRTRFDFARVSMRRSDLFARRFVTLTAAPLREAPHASAAMISEAPAGTVLEATDVQDNWFVVRHSGGAPTYIEGRYIQVLPQRVAAAQRDAQLREGPGLMYESMAQVNLQGEFSVLDRQDRFGQGMWYRLQVGDRAGWVQGDLLQPRFILPVEHFIAGLSEYRGQRFESTHRELTQFMNTPDVKLKSVNLAVAYQLQGASRLSFQTPLGAVESKDLSAFSKAIDLTPFDPAAYNLRALARFGATRQLEDVLADLKQALDLDPENVQARAFVNTLVEVAESGAIALPDLEWLAAFVHLERIRLGPHQLLQTNARAIGPHTDGDGSVMTIENQTATALRLYLVGPVSRIVELSQGQSKDIDLDEGKYALAAEFSPDAQDKPPRVRPMYSLQTYDPQTRYALKFHVQWQRHR